MPTRLNDLVENPQQLHHFDTYSTYLTSDFADHLADYLPVFEKSRKKKGHIPSVSAWKKLPFGNANPDWKWRRQSLAVLNRFIGQEKFGNVLEIGAWNGWLTKQLAKKSESVIAVDYFVYPFDGIGNIIELGANIQPMQCNLATIATDFKPATFDLIVINHCLSYTDIPIDYIRNLIPLLRPNGKIISLGNTFYREPQNKIAQNDATAATFLNQYQIPLYIAPVKGYMDWSDLETLEKSGFEIKPYPQQFLQNQYARFKPNRPVYTAIIYR